MIPGLGMFAEAYWVFAIGNLKVRWGASALLSPSLSFTLQHLFVQPGFITFLQASPLPMNARYR